MCVDVRPQEHYRFIFNIIVYLYMQRAPVKSSVSGAFGVMLLEATRATHEHHASVLLTANARRLRGLGCSGNFTSYWL